jgi:putative two-component system response regulator
MHDVGKIGIPDNILLKPGKLDHSEWTTMMTHTQIGAEIIGDDPSDIMRLASIVARCHHEKWDGSGYPNQLQQESIPLEARIVAIADVYDALTSIRPYKNAWSHEDAVAFIRNNVGTHFDPHLVECFIQVLPDVIGIRLQYHD